MEKLNLLKDDEKKVFYHYLIPSICSTLVTSIYILVDTLIIGQGVGAAGISALNIFLPFFAIYNGIGLMFGLGGGILISMEDGIGNKEKSDKYFISSLIAVTIIGLIFTIFTNVFLEQISYFLGANENSIGLVLEYGRCITLFTPVFIATNFLSPIIRNKKAPKLAMISVLIGAGLNIVLDYIFVFPMNMGMVGAALATVIGSLTTVAVLLTHFISKKNRIKVYPTYASIKMIKKIIGCGGSSFLMEGMALFNGVAQASQPIIATNYGAKESKRVKTVLKYAMFTTISIGCLLFTVVFMFTEEVIYAFVKANDQIISMGVPAVRAYLSAFCIMNINILFCNYFQSVGKEKTSILISAIRGFLLNIILVLSLPVVLGGSSLWFVVPTTEIITLVGIVIYIRKLKGNSFKSETKLNKCAIAE